MGFEKTRYPSVWKKKLQNGDISYYITYREPGDKSPKRKKVGIKSKGMTAKKARSFLVNREGIVSLNQGNIPAIDTKDYAMFYQRIRGDKPVTLYLLAQEYFIVGIEDRFGTVMSLMRETEKYKNGPLNRFGKNFELVGDLEYLSRLLKAAASFSSDPIEASKIRNYDKNVRQFINNMMPIREFIITPLSDLDYGVIHGCKTYWREQGKSQKTIADNFHMIKAIISWAYNADAYKGSNFLANYKVKTGKQKRERYLTEQEISKLMRRLRKENFNVYLSAYLALLTAGRALTVLNIQKRDIDFEKRLIRLKNIKKKRVYIIPFSEDKDKFLWKATAHLDDDDYLIHSLRTGADKKKPLSKIPVKYYDVVKELFNSKLHPKKDRLIRVNFHTLRHTVATQMIKNKVDLYEVSKFLDHSSIEETQRYAKLDSEDLVSAASTIKLPTF